MLANFLSSPGQLEERTKMQHTLSIVYFACFSDPVGTTLLLLKNLIFWDKDEEEDEA